MKRSALSIGRLGVASLFGALAVCCSDTQAGYVNVRLLSFVAPSAPLYLGDTPLSGIGDHIIEHDVGTVSLTSGGFWPDKTFCELQVRSNRITTVTMRLVNGQPRCECEIAALESTPAKAICR